MDSHSLYCDDRVQRVGAYRAVKQRTPAEQQPNRAVEPGAQQAAYEALNAARLCKVPLKWRDLVWAATQQCGLSDTPQGVSAASADAAVVSRAAQRNDLLRDQGIAIPWDHVTEWEVTHFWMAERGLEEGSPYLKQLLKFAAGKRSGDTALISHLLPCRHAGPFSRTRTVTGTCTLHRFQAMQSCASADVTCGQPRKPRRQEFDQQHFMQQNQHYAQAGFL